MAAFLRNANLAKKFNNNNPIQRAKKALLKEKGKNMLNLSFEGKVVFFNLLKDWLILFIDNHLQVQKIEEDLLAIILYYEEKDWEKEFLKLCISSEQYSYERILFTECWKVVKHARRMGGFIINLTQHEPTPEQEGVFNPSPFDREKIINLMNFNVIPERDNLKDRAEQIANIVYGCALGALVGGAPYFMAPLEKALKERDIQPLYAFSIRESKEHTLPDGRVVKTNTFKHKGFIKA